MAAQETRCGSYAVQRQREATCDHGRDQVGIPPWIFSKKNHFGFCNAMFAKKNKKERIKKIMLNRFNGEITMEQIAVYMDDELREKIAYDIAPCTDEEFLQEYVNRDPEFCVLLEYEFDIDIEPNREQTFREQIESLAGRIRYSSEWVYDWNRELCRYAGILDEWEHATDADFEEVVYKAADILNVYIA